MNQKILDKISEYICSGYNNLNNPFVTNKSKHFEKYISGILALGGTALLIVAYVSQIVYKPISTFLLVWVYFLSGTEPFVRSINHLRKFNINIHVLMVAASIFASLIGHPMEGGLLLVLFSLSEYLEKSVMQETKRVLHSLMEIMPNSTNMLAEDGSIMVESTKNIKVNQKILVKIGEIVPLDGIITKGSSYIDMSCITGESIPIQKTVGDRVASGGINLDGALEIRITKIGTDSSLSKIVSLIVESQEAKPKVQTIIDRFGRVYAPLTMMTALILGVTLPWFTNLSYLGVSGSIYKSLAFLIASAPCPLILAIPTAYLSSISACAKNGILLKGGTILEAISHCTQIGFDKTGTLTTGNLTLKNIKIEGKISEETALTIAYSIEIGQIHPIANAIIKHCKSKNIKPLPTKNVTTIPGFGVEGEVQLTDKNVKSVMGSNALMKRLNRPVEKIEHSKKEIKISSFLAIEDTLVHFEFVDETREQSINVISKLSNMMTDIFMLTGDSKENATLVGKKLGIEQIYSELTPQDKADKIKQLSKKNKVIVVGDGLNDAAALAIANVGIALGQIGNNLTIETSDIVLLRDNINSIPWLISQSKKTLSIIRQNLALSILAIFFNICFSLTGLFPLWGSVILHEGSTILVVLNSVRLLKNQ